MNFCHSERVHSKKSNTVFADIFEMQEKLLVDVVGERSAVAGERSSPATSLSETKNSSRIVSVDTRIILPDNKQTSNEVCDEVRRNHGWSDLLKSLSEIQKEALKILVSNKNVTEKLERLKSSNNNLLIEVLFEEINELSLECVGDNIIETAETPVYIYEDYVAQIKKLLKTI
ncbi:hypothetical protein FACS189465_3600 [Clostridia bacterium]|nr:hypothetical protein FACS189465_3600 [Clostridia bacterium]